MLLVYIHILKIILKDLYINQIYFCPYFRGSIKKYKIDSNFRKLKIGMYLKIKNWFISNKYAKMIGDRNSDMLFAKNAGIKLY